MALNSLKFSAGMMLLRYAPCPMLHAIYTDTRHLKPSHRMYILQIYGKLEKGK
jgi:hypothetical protein